MKALLDMYQNAYRVMAPPLSPFEFFQKPAAPAGPFVEAATEPRREAPGYGQGKDRDLKRRVEELESLVTQLRGKPGARKRRSPRRKS